MKHGQPVRAVRDDLGGYLREAHFLADKPKVGPVSLADAHELALARNQYRYGDLLNAA